MRFCPPHIGRRGGGGGISRIGTRSIAQHGYPEFCGREPSKEGSSSDGQPGSRFAQEKSAESKRLKKESPNELTPDEERQVEELKHRDHEVRAHEQAHKSGWPYGGAISLSYQTGPDGKRYAIGGEVPVDISPIKGDLKQCPEDADHSTGRTGSG